MVVASEELFQRGAFNFTAEAQRFFHHKGHKDSKDTKGLFDLHRLSSRKRSVFSSGIIRRSTSLETHLGDSSAAEEKI